MNDKEKSKSESTELEEDESAPGEIIPMSYRRGPSRSTQFTSKYKGMLGVEFIIHKDSAFLVTLYGNASRFSFSSASSYYARDMYLTEKKTIENIHPCAFVAKVHSHDKDHPTYKGILKGDKEEKDTWDKAMVKELTSLADLGSFQMVNMPRGTSVLQSTWEFRRKRYPDGSLKTYKARFCVRGYQQIQGVDVFDTYAPVVFWITVRFLLVFSIILNMHTQQVD